MDERIKRLSSLLTEYSCRVQQGENVCLRYEGEAPKELILQLIRDVYRLGARPFVIRQDNSILRELLIRRAGRSAAVVRFFAPPCR